MSPRAVGRSVVVVLALALAAEAPVAAAQDPFAEDERQTAWSLTTPWTDEVSRTDPLPEHPRPQLRRDAGGWRSLNGRWEFGEAEPGQEQPPARLPERILVPFPVQSALSGVGRNEPQSWYRRTFRLPRSFGSRRVVLHFGAVTHAATVFVNGRRVGRHAGSYDAFSFDVTGAVRRRGRNTLVVRVSDPMAYGGGQPVGKQIGNPVSVLFTASTGIWQTVWLEAVDRTHVERLDLVPDVARERLVVRPRIRAARGAEVVVVARDGRRTVARARARAGRPLALRIRDPKLWSPERPFLYDVDVEVRRGRRVVDRADSYAGMRSVGMARIGGVMRPTLNGRFVFQSGPLDQGYWPDGVYTAPTDAALRFDIEQTKAYGFNLIRKHVKVEPQRWYFHADRLGVLVWQDMPNMTVYLPVSEAAGRGFERELREVVDEHRSSPAVTTWVPFNEGWGEFDVERITGLTKRLDPSRLVIGHSGSANCCLATEPPNGDLRDGHIYNGPLAPPPDARRGSVIGEYNACSDRSPANEVPRGGTSSPIEAFDGTRRQNRGLIRRAWAGLIEQMRRPGLSGAVFTETTDVEAEVGGGLLTFDRRVRKCEPGLLRTVNRRLVAASRRVANLRPRRGAVPRGTTGLWTFDERGAGVARDTSGRGRDLTLAGGAAIGAGRRGGALVVGGGAGRATSAAPVVDTAGSYSVSAWVRHRDGAQTAPVVGQAAGDRAAFSLGLLTSDERADLDPGYATGVLTRPAETDRRWAFHAPGRRDCAEAACVARASPAYGDGRLNPPAGRWFHLVAVADHRGEGIVLYLDGAMVDQRIAKGFVAADGPFTVGGGGPVGALPGAGFVGEVDQVRTYGRALSAREVAELHAAEAAR